MSTNNIGFYEEISKIIPELSSNIIKYAPYLFFYSDTLNFAVIMLKSKERGFDIE